MSDSLCREKEAHVKDQVLPVLPRNRYSHGARGSAELGGKGTFIYWSNAGRLVEPNVLEAPSVEQAVDHQDQIPDPRLPAGGSPGIENDWPRPLFG